MDSRCAFERDICSTYDFKSEDTTKASCDPMSPRRSTFVDCMFHPEYASDTDDMHGICSGMMGRWQMTANKATQILPAIIRTSGSEEA